MFFADLTSELPEEAARAGVTPEQMSEWTLRFDVSDLPCLGLFREVLHDKLLEPRTTWDSNDLVDMVYLTCGAAYADHVVSERHLAGQMTQGLRRLGRPVNVHRRLSELVDVLRVEHPLAVARSG
jgi:hypothetical protein